MKAWEAEQAAKKQAVIDILSDREKIIVQAMETAGFLFTLWEGRSEITFSAGEFGYPSVFKTWDEAYEWINEAQLKDMAHDIALALELFTTGTLNVFAHQTNINSNNRLLCFDIQDLGENLKPVGLLVMLDAIFNRVIRNRQRGRYTHLWIRTWLMPIAKETR